MNKIIVSKEKINYIGDSALVIDGSKIIFKEASDYEIIYDNIDDVCLELEIINGRVVILESSFGNKLRVNNIYNIHCGSADINKFYCNESVSEKITINLFEDGDTVDYNFANICKSVEEYQIDVYHKNKNTKSNIRNKVVAINDSRVHFVINSTVYKECIKSVLDQNTRVVTFDNAEATVSPNMFIDLDDVMAKHGSVIGTFKDDQIFYLMSKGISYNDSLKLLVRGFLLANKMISVDTRKKITDIIDMYWR